ncbi:MULTISPECIES: SDR family NAD(P)-dependent oxidoreductase [unclassified Pseudonocardia]|jgi:NAD(P)-dependent dehydrogenase (short-subunit alcohol dehydrogenase family)|uniref:SDR family NAD(P)-dependent oxidoreductase n=1 Tax=unclassified Pseudonocardia TaxID=2619320 RepID=UPI000965AB03|nr:MULTISPECIES: SDR family NAD(P)-dependent oxidoreductase [unclassified Pseudonocardia]MBN9099818.1 SDR family oxidoreductase [Pseudonocardia sp.]OJY45497.1 MAG: short-chain dehydrogenase [Pseudonocardia sp. 73-21]
MGVLDGRTAVVTGGARGIGAAISRRFAAEGAAVVVNDLGGGPDGSGSDAGAAEAIVAEIRATGGRAVADGGDIADTDTGKRLVATAVEEFGGLDVLVNSAGVLRDRMIFNMSDEEWDVVIRVHLRGHFSASRAAAAYFREQRNPDGHYRIVNFTSHSGLEGSPGQANYATAKMGVVGLTYSLAQGLARYGVTANAIAPAAATRLVATVPQERKAIQDRPADDDPSRSPDNIAALALYLASDRSGWLTGRVLGAVGFSVGVYQNPTVIGEVTSDGPWSFDDLAAQMERDVREVADGLPPSLFAAQAANRKA